MRGRISIHPVHPQLLSSISFAILFLPPYKSRGSVKTFPHLNTMIFSQPSASLAFLQCLALWRDHQLKLPFPSVTQLISLLVSSLLLCPLHLSVSFLPAGYEHLPKSVSFCYTIPLNFYFLSKCPDVTPS